MLAQSGQIELAERQNQQLSDPNLSDHERARLARIIAEAKGTSPTKVPETQFKTSNALTNIANLVESLGSQKDWLGLVTYGRTFFRAHA